MVVEYIRYQVPAQQHHEFIAAYHSATAELEASPHCIGFEMSHGIEEPDNFIVRIAWDSIEGHEKGFRTSALFGPFFNKVKPFFSGIQEMKHYQVTASGKGAGAR